MVTAGLLAAGSAKVGIMVYEDDDKFLCILVKRNN